MRKRTNVTVVDDEKRMRSIIRSLVIEKDDTGNDNEDGEWRHFTELIAFMY